MNTGLHPNSASEGAEELLRAPATSLAVATIAPADPAKSKPGAPAGRRLPFGLVLSPERALHQGMISLADQSVASVTNFATGIIIARTCSKEEMGLYMLGFSLILLMTDFQTSLITTPYMVFSPRLKGRAHALYTGSTLIHQCAFCLLTMAGVVSAAFAVSHGFGRPGLGPVLWSLSIVIALIMLREHARRVSFARLRLKTAFLFDTCIAIGQIAGLLLLARFGWLSASRAFWVIGLVCGVAVLGWLWSDRECYSPRFPESLADFKKNWVFGKWVFASGLVWALGMNLYPWFLAYFHGTASTGVWAACLGVVSVGNPLLMGIQNYLGPKIAHVYAAYGSKALHHFVLKITAILFFPVSLLCLVLMLWGGRFVVLLYGRQYGGNNLVVAILSINLLIMATTFSFSRALMAIERADLDFLVNFAALFIMLVVGFWLVRAFGTLGAALGFLTANLVTSLIRVAVFLGLPNRAQKVGVANVV
jgi:O-antigen/teichoic acid export membrane protein